MADCDLLIRRSDRRQLAANRSGSRRREPCLPRAIQTIVLAAAGAAALILAAPAFAQAPPVPPYVPCPEDNAPLIQIPELVSQNGKLRGTILLSNGLQRLYLGDTSPDGKTRWCLPQNVRQFRGIRAEAATYRGEPPQGYPAVVPTPPLQYLDPVPGPTLRARLGDIVQLTFLNQINPGVGWRSIDRGEGAEGCDHNRDLDGNVLYPALDVFPNCFHGSSTGNIHFHGTHTNPGSTGDNIFIEVRPSLRDNDQPIVTETSVKKSFDEFFFHCETELNKSVLSQWPRTWADLPRTYTRQQEALLKRYDSNPRITRKLWPVDEAQRKAGEWPQYYIGAFPYCFRLPEYTDTKWPPDAPAHPPSHTGVARDKLRPLLMGQVPGIHWYHAHKHGSTAINVANGMTGAFIIEGPYDDALNTYYGEASAGPRTWTQSQPLMVINQLGTVPGLFTGAGGRLPLSVNGGFQPTVKMRPGEVQMWRIVNTSSRSGVYFDGIYPEPRPAVPSDGSTPP